MGQSKYQDLMAEAQAEMEAYDDRARQTKGKRRRPPTSGLYRLELDVDADTLSTLQNIAARWSTKLGRTVSLGEALRRQLQHAGSMRRRREKQAVCIGEGDGTPDSEDPQQLGFGL